MPRKKKKDKEKEPPPPPKAGPPKPKKRRKPPACFTKEDLAKFKAMFRAFDEEHTDTVPVDAIPLMLRQLGFNPKGAEIQELYRLFLEDDQVETVEYYQWLLMIEAKMNWGDDFEYAVTKALAALGHDNEETGFCDFTVLRDELFTWGEPLTEIEFMAWVKLAIKNKSYKPSEGRLCYAKFVDIVNSKDEKFIKEPINYFKLDQKTLAALAQQKVQEEREAQERKDAEKKAREEAKRLKMIEDGLLPPDKPIKR